MNVKGAKGFDAYYSRVFGDRWEGLRAELAKPARQVLRLNAFAAEKDLAARFPAERRQSFGTVTWIADDDAQPSPSETAHVLDAYRMDLASVLPAVALDTQPGDRVLDMCAAPGGKTLILAEAIKDQGELTANEISDNRRARLNRVIREYVPKPVASRIQVTGHDAARWCLHEKDSFDRILLDAPCSGERHLLEDAGELKTWSEARSKNLSVRQYALLASAIQTVKPGGRVVYSTCSLSTRENDDVISRLLKRRAGEARVLPVETTLAPPFGEATTHGWIVLPDRSGYGPIYFSILERL